MILSDITAAETTTLAAGDTLSGPRINLNGGGRSNVRGNDQPYLTKLHKQHQSSSTNDIDLEPRTISKVAYIERPHYDSAVSELRVFSNLQYILRRLLEVLLEV